MKKIIVISFILVTALLLTGCSARFNGTETADATHFVLDFYELDGTKWHEMTLGEDAIIDVIIEAEQGRIDIMVTGENDEAIYKSSDVDSMVFSLIIRKAGTYRFVVMGDKAAGMVNFTAYP